jgi:N-acetylmuramic acid 6-phosphate etherase
VSSGPFFIGIDGGGTHTTAALAGADGAVRERRTGGAGNVRLLADDPLSALFRQFTDGWPTPAGVCAAMAGVRTETDRARVRAAAERAWPGAPVVVASDLDAAFRACEADESAPGAAHVLVLSGTGSCAFGRDARGRPVKSGGWGHVLGDRGSAYDAGLLGLRETLATFDHTGRWPRLGERILRALTLNQPDDLIAWAAAVPKAEVAALATEVFAAAGEGDPTARRIVATLAERLAADALACARRLAARDRTVIYHFAGGLLTHQPRLAAAVWKILRRESPGCRRARTSPDAARGACLLAMEGAPGAKEAPAASSSAGPERRQVNAPTTTGPSPTESRHPETTGLDRMPTEQAVGVMLADWEAVGTALRAVKGPLTALVREAARAIRSGGRILYAGAGTSGRLGVLDASECPPTFRADPEQVQGIIAGGWKALTSAVEGAEDDRDAGGAAVAGRGAGKKDLVIGLAASGTTPFVWGALDEARRRGAVTALICCNPNLRPPRGLPRHLVVLDTGPEVLTGSTRLKAGSATKAALNVITTLAFVQAGKVMSNLMIDLNPANVKLRDRAVRITAALTGADAGAAREALEKAGWVVRAAVESPGVVPLAGKRRGREVGGA